MRVEVLFPETVNYQFKLGGCYWANGESSVCAAHEKSASMLANWGRRTVEDNFDVEE